MALGDAVHAIRKIEQQSGKPQSLVTTFQGNANAFLSSLAGEPLLIAAALSPFSPRSWYQGGTTGNDQFGSRRSTFFLK